MSFAQDIMLKDFLAGAASALQKAQSGEVPAEERVRDIPASTLAVEHADGRKEEVVMPAMQVKQFVHRCGLHDVAMEYGDFTSDFSITLSPEVLGKMTEADRAVLEKVSVYSEFIGTGERAPVLVVPAALQQQAEKWLQKAGMTFDADRNNPYAEGTYSIRQGHRSDGGAVSVLHFGWDTFKHIGEALGTGASVAATK